MKDGVVHMEQAMVVLGLGVTRVNTETETFKCRLIPCFVIGVSIRFKVVLDSDNEGLVGV